ncbi:MAG: HNH endonuclease [Bdellovibrionaceae bacterium]|nr:HNH endonuclease [Pseudobdellovibrionaceae bacterium]
MHGVHSSCPSKITFPIKNDLPTKDRRPTSVETTIFLRVSASPNPESAISLKTKRHLLAKARNACEYKDTRTGRICQANFQHEVDHIKPLALGGVQGTENLRILCRAHNQLAAKKSGLRRLRLGHHP